jgi:hypothetical protein
MMADRSNVSKEPVNVRKPKKGPVSMALPRTDSGKIIKAVGDRPNNSAANYADAMDFIAGSALPGRSQESGR